MIAYQIRQCSQADCRFRYPALAYQPSPDHCPRCGAPAAVVHEVRKNRENPVAKRPTAVQPHAVLLDNLRSAWNVGSIFRTADGAGIQHLHLCGITPTPAHPGVQKTALGAEQSIEWSWHPNGADLARHLQANGYTLWALEETPEAQSIFNAGWPQPTSPLILLIGNEISGVDPIILAHCERVLYIPMYGVKRSLNVAVATGIAIYALQHCRQRC